MERQQGRGAGPHDEQWSSDILVFTDGLSPSSPAMFARLQQQGIGVCTDRIARLEGTADGKLKEAVTKGGWLGLSGSLSSFACQDDLERLLHYRQRHPSILVVTSSSFTRECQRLPEMIASGAQELRCRVKIAAVKK
jgi:hypothetical protein